LIDVQGSSMQRTDPTDAHAVESSIELAVQRGADLTPRVYERLFAQQPEMLALFCRDHDGQIKGEMLMRVFEALFDFIGERRYADNMIQCEVVTHEGYDVPRDVFATFFGVVAQVVRDVCGDAWTTDMDRAWHRTLADLDHYVKHPAA
jgi:hemoglobin-like flavoprotein